MRVRGSAGELRAPRRGWGFLTPATPPSGQHAEGLLQPGRGQGDQERRGRVGGAPGGGEGEGRAGAGRPRTRRSCIIQQLGFRARLFPGSGSLLQTLFMGQSGAAAAALCLLLLRLLAAERERPGPGRGM
nr:methyl-CpG-binding domain protein 2-like [Equus asinus]